MERYTGVFQKLCAGNMGSVGSLRGQGSQQIKVGWMGRRRTDGGQWRSTWKREFAKQLEVQMGDCYDRGAGSEGEEDGEGHATGEVDLNFDFIPSAHVCFFSCRPIKLDAISPSSTPRGPCT